MKPVNQVEIKECPVQAKPQTRAGSKPGFFQRDAQSSKFSREELPTPPPLCPVKTVATQGYSQTVFHDRRGTFCLLAGVRGMLPQKMLKPRGSEMLFSALFMRSFFKNLI